MLQTIEYNNKEYLSFQTEGNAAQYIQPFAKKLCIGEGYDIGCMKKEWSLPNSIPIDIDFDDEFDALNLPDTQMDYIFSSHCLEHIPDWVGTLNYWYDRLKTGGIMFLYLPDYSQEYWRPWNNRKHINVLSSDIIRDYMTYKGFKKIFTTGTDLFNSFTVVGEK